MAEDCNILTPLQRDGTSRVTRSVEALQPSTLLIDGRSLADFAQYISQLSTLIQFYDEKNTASGNWQPFFKDDASFLTAQIAKTDYRIYANTYTPLIRLDKNDIATQWADFFTPTLSIIAQLDGWYKQSTEGLSIQAALYRLNVSVLIEATTQLIAIAKRGEQIAQPLPTFEGYFLKDWVGKLSFGQSIDYLTIQPDKSILKDTALLTTADDYDTARKKLKTIFDRTYQAIVGIVQTAPQYLEDSLTHYPQHKPHVALFWAFLKLLEHVQTDINALSASHLDFYYREVLQLKPKAALPDSVHIIFEIARNFFAYEVKKGTYLKDGKDALGVDILFKTDQALIVNNIVLDTEGLKTVYVEREIGEIKNIYAAPKANTNDGIADPPTNGQWRAFGNKTMPYASLGFAIASPQLLLQEGTRTITFIFHFKELFDTGKKAAIQNEIKNNVNIFLTGQKGWVLAEIETVTLVDIEDEYRRQVAEYEQSILNKKIEILWLHKTLPPAQNLRNNINKLIIENNTALTLSDEENIVNKILALPLKRLSNEQKTEILWIYEKLNLLNVKKTPFRDKVEDLIEDKDTLSSLNKELQLIRRKINKTLTEDEKLDVLWILTKIDILENKDKGRLSPFTNRTNTNPFKTTSGIFDFNTQNILKGRPSAPPKKIEAKMRLSITVKLDRQMPSIVNYTPSVHGSNFTTNFPIAQFLFNNEGLSGENGFTFKNIDKITPFDVEKKPQSTTGLIYETDDLVVFENVVYKATKDIITHKFPQEDSANWVKINSSYPYRHFQSFGQLLKLSINITVQDMKNFILENDIGVLNAAKPFMPFGAVPKVGSSFLIGNYEIFKKPTANLTLNVEWGNLPSAGLKTYYTTIKGDITEKFFAVRYEILQEGKWNDISVAPNGNNLIIEDETNKVTNSDSYIIHATDSTFLKQKIKLTINDSESDLRLEPFTEFSNILQAGFMRVKLKQDFLYNEYVQKVLADAKPNPPYTPTISSFSIDYTANETIDFNEDYETQIEQLFQIHPFGTVEMYPNETKGSLGRIYLSDKIVPEFLSENDKIQAQGTLYIGLKNVQATDAHEDQIVSILFQVAEGSEDPNKQADPIQWCYLVGNEWINFEDTQIISDTTYNFLRSGIIQFNLPAEMDGVHTVLKQGVFWIKAAIAANNLSDTEGVCRMVGIHPQAVESTFESIGNDPNRVATALEGNAIARLQERVAEIKKVMQPYASFGGRPTEADAAFYVRISERLRHKQRAVTMWDYEHLVLEAFPEVYKVRCIPHAKVTKPITDKKLLESEYAPGYVTLIAVPNLRNQNAYNPLRPTLSQNKLGEIQAFLQQIADDFVEIAVHNPVFETIYTTFRVAFRKEYPDKGFYKNKLQHDIIKFLSPWIYDDGIELSFGGKIHRSAILNFVEKLEYVDFIDNFKLFHQGKEVENAVASTSASVLIPDAPSQFKISDTSAPDCAVFQVKLDCPTATRFNIDFPQLGTDIIVRR